MRFDACEIPACFMNAHIKGATSSDVAVFEVRVRFPSFADLVVLAGSLNPIPSRTRPLNSPAPMILSLKAWKSRSLPGLPKTEILLDTMKDLLCKERRKSPRGNARAFVVLTGRPFASDCRVRPSNPRCCLCANPRDVGRDGQPSAAALGVHVGVAPLHGVALGVGEGGAGVNEGGFAEHADHDVLGA